MEKFSQKVKQARSELNLTHEQLGEMCGISRRTIFSYEQGEREPRASTLLKLAKALKVSTKFLSDDDCNDPMECIEQDGYIEEARAQYGKKGQMDIEELLSANTALFAGGEYPQEDKDAFFQAILKSYFDCKEEASKKFGNKKS